jgi:hypothetical protein
MTVSFSRSTLLYGVRLVLWIALKKIQGIPLTLNFAYFSCVYPGYDFVMD